MLSGVALLAVRQCNNAERGDLDGLIADASQPILAGAPENGNVWAATIRGVTGTRRRNRCRSFHRVMVHVPVWGRACAHSRGGQPCSTGSGAAPRTAMLRNNLSP